MGEDLAGFIGAILILSVALLDFLSVPRDRRYLWEIQAEVRNYFRSQDFLTDRSHFFPKWRQDSAIGMRRPVFFYY